MLTVSLELAKKMKELWRTKECWFILRDRQIYASPDKNYTEVEFKIHPFGYELLCSQYDTWHAIEYFAPTAQEILDELPKHMEWEWLYSLNICAHAEGDSRCASYAVLDNGVCVSEMFASENLAEALWQLRCWCKENWYTK